MNTIKDFIKREALALIAFIAALISCFLVPVTNYVEYIDTELIGILFGLMAVVAGFAENNVFKRLSELTVRMAGDTRRLAFILVMTVFFSSMFITNDVALIAFIPFTLMIYSKIGHSPIYVIVLQTVAANMGSGLTPVGNPQNLYLFSVSGMSAADFFKITLQITAISLIMLILCCCIIKKEAVLIDNNGIITEIKNPRYLFLYGALFILCLLAVFDKVDTISVFASVCVVIAIIQPEIFSRVDYGLLFTFACFFIFVGNIKNIPAVTEFASAVISNREFECTLLTSQLISNVPAAVMLSAFTDNYKELILGADIGGLGTLIASLASLISYKNYIRSENCDSKRFIGIFTLVNIIFLIVLVAYAELIIL